MINAESLAEVLLLDGVARELGLIVPLSLRVNPEVTIESFHDYIKTGERGQKFGIPYDEALDVANTALSLPNTSLMGLDMHIGSQIFGFDSYGAALDRLISLYDRVCEEGATTLKFLDIGGGLAVAYADETPPDISRFGHMIATAIGDRPVELIVEPGRVLVGNAGVMLARVLYRKRSGGKDYVISDGGMNDLLRPSHYHAYHRIESAAAPRGRSIVDVVGPVCESGDFFARDREMDSVSPGDLLVVHSTGAYGFVMSSNYNARPRPAEVLVRGGQFAVVTVRERYEDLVGRELEDLDWNES